MIHQSSRLAETFHEFHLARNANIHIVHPQWLFKCRSGGIRCAEEEWGWTLDIERTPSVGLNSATPSPEHRREKRMRQNENMPPDRNGYTEESIKIEQLTKLIGTLSSPQKKARRKLTGRARNTDVSTNTSSVASADEIAKRDDDPPRPTQERVEYKDPIAEREMAKIIANLQGITDEEKSVEIQSEMTPAEDIGRKSARRKSARK